MFRFKILNLSRQMGNAKLRIRVKPTDPDLAANQHLCIETRAFESRGRMLDENEKRKAAEKLGRRSSNASWRVWQIRGRFDPWCSSTSSAPRRRASCTRCPRRRTSTSCCATSS